MRFLQMSFYGAVLILAIVLIRAVALNKLPKRTFLALWGIAVFRLLCPFSIPSVFSVYSIIGKGLAYTESTAKELMFDGLPPTPTEITGTEYINQVSSTVAGNTGGSFEFPLLFVIWIIGVLVFSLFFLVCYIKCRREFLIALPAENGFIDTWISEHRHLRKIDVRVSDRISSPLTYGTVCPVILLPKKLDLEDENELNFILAHEYVHIRNFDSVKKLLLLITAILHWFNPLVWIMYILAVRDIELCCDECVMRQFGVKSRAAYSMMLLQLEEKRSGVTALCNNFSKNAIEERIESIMKFKKKSALALALAIMLVGGTATVFATEALAVTASNGGSWISRNDATLIEGDGGLQLEDVTGEQNSGDVTFFSGSRHLGVEISDDDAISVLSNSGNGVANLEKGTSVTLGVGNWTEGQIFTLSCQSDISNQIVVHIIDKNAMTSEQSYTLENGTGTVSFPVSNDGCYCVSLENLSEISADLKFSYSLSNSQPITETSEQGVDVHANDMEDKFGQLSATDDNVEDYGTVAVQKAYSSPFSKAEKESDSFGNDATIEWDEIVDFPTQSEKTSISANSSIYYNFGVGTNNTYYEAGTKISFFIQCVNADIPVQVSLLTADKTTVISSQKVESDEVETISFTIPEDGDYLLCVTNESASRTQEYSHMIAN